MKKRILISLLLISLFALSTAGAQTLKVAVTADRGNRYSKFFSRLAEKSGINLRPVPLLPREMADALNAGIVDMAVLSESDISPESARPLGQTAVWETPMVLIGGEGFHIREENLTSLRSIGVFPGDEELLQRNIIDRYSLDARIQRARQYDSLVKIMASGRVSAIFLPLPEFEKSLTALGENKENFGTPFDGGTRKEFLFIASAGTGKAAPLKDKLARTLAELVKEGRED